MLLTLSVNTVSAVEGTLFSKAIAAFVESDLPTVSPANYTASIDWGDGRGSVVATPVLTDPAQKLYTVFGSKAYVADGSYTITVGIGGTGTPVAATASGTATVTAINLDVTPGVVNALLAQPLPPGSTLATFTDAYPNLTPAGYRADISWGDGATSTGVITQDATTKVYSVGVASNDTHRYAQAGTPAATVTVTRIVDTASVTVSPTIKVINPPITLTPTTLQGFVGSSISGVVARFSDTYPGGTYQATINWGDNSTSTGSITPVSGSPGLFEISGSRSYVAAGTFALTVTLKRVETSTTVVLDSASTGGGSSVVVAGYNLDAKATPGTLNLFVAQPAPTGTPLATFTDTYPNLTPASYRADINWGDNKSSAGVITLDPVTRVFTVAVAQNDPHRYAADVTAPTVAVTITRLVDGATKTVNPVVNVSIPSIVITPTTFIGKLGVAVEGEVARFSDSYPNASYQAVINWGDGTVSNGNVSPVAGSPGLFQVLGTHTYQRPGSSDLTVTVTRVDTNTSVVLPATSTASRSVASVAPYTFTATLDPTPGTLTPTKVMVTSNNRPSFSGTAAPFTTVRMTAIGSGFLGNTILGQTTANADGFWHLATGPLPDGSYQMTAVFVTSVVGPSSAVPLLNVDQSSVLVANGILIDTVAPTVLGVRYQKVGKAYELVLETVDLASGLQFDPNQLAGLNDINNFAVVPVHQVGGANISGVPLISVNTVINDARSVTTRIRLARKITPRTFRLLLASRNITDLAGNPLAFPFRGIPIPSLTQAVRATRAK